MSINAKARDVSRRKGKRNQTDQYYICRSKQVCAKVTEKERNAQR